MLRHSHLYGRTVVYDCGVFEARLQRCGGAPAESVRVRYWNKLANIGNIGPFFITPPI